MTGNGPLIPKDEGVCLDGRCAVVSAGDELLGEALTYDRIIWRYDGSLTTPPCSEAVKWLVMQAPVEVSRAQIAAYTAIFSGNARPVQPLNDRELIVGQLPPMLPTTGAPASALPAAAIVVIGVLVTLGIISWRRRIDQAGDDKNSRENV